MASAKDVMKKIADNEVKFVDFRFTDTRGKEQHVTVPISHFDEDKFASGHAFGPSQSAASGSGCVSRNNPATPAATAARASTGTCCRSPPEDAPRAPGCCTACVASNTTGQRVSRKTASARMSTTKLL